MTAPVTGSVVESAPLGRHLQRLVIYAPELDRLHLPWFGDAALGIYFASPGNSAPTARTYTVRDHDPSASRITVDVVLHGDAAGTRWATNATPGERVELAHAKSWFRPPRHADRHVLAADLAGLPAIARLIEQRGHGDTTAIVEVRHEDDLDYLPKQRTVKLIASIGTGNGVTDSVLPQLVAQHCSAVGLGYCWFAGEASEARTVRKFLRHEQGWTTEQTDVVGYWRRDADRWSDRFAPHGPRMYSIYEKAVAEGKSEKVALEEFDEALERLGL
ncbi:siderophore-interacting protein [Mycolicibacterium tusciae]|uniref:siderophore-interacting protein n=1 Tax=Mycolicibacterium tusciae TaxID=75922 RepID=UPI00059055BF|nr:siderophore-interacting protein [Mycolicibacterium tusciae]